MLLRRLYPLWESLARAVPHVVLDPPRTRVIDVWSPRNVHVRLPRRVIEIRDAITAISSRVPSGLPTAAEELARSAGLDAVERAAAAEAAWVAAGCRLSEVGAPKADQPARPRDAGSSVSEEASWLAQVAAAAPFAAWAGDRLVEEHQLLEVDA